MESFYKGGRRFILDGAHNPISIKEQVRSLRTQKVRDPWLVFGAMSDKKSREMLRVLAGFFPKVILTAVAGNRAKPVAMLVDEAKGLFKCVLTAQNVREAFDISRKASNLGATIVVTGSFYLVGEARKLLKAG
jgi:dihydrofolate synthase / folylpolyglutamate synthase